MVADLMLNAQSNSTLHYNVHQIYIPGRFIAGAAACASIFGYRLDVQEDYSTILSSRAAIGVAYNCFPGCGKLNIWWGISANHYCLIVLLTLIIVLLLAALGILYACYRLWLHRRVQRDSKDPKTWPFLGSQLEAARNYDRLIDWITGYFSDDHRTIKMSFLSRCSYLTVDPANVEYILKTNFQNYPKGQESHHRLFDLLGNGILNTDGSTWKTHRKLGSLEFSIRKLRHLSATVYKGHALKLVEVLRMHSSAHADVRHADQGGGGGGGVDMQELLLAMTLNSICEVVFGNAVTKSGVCTEEASTASALDSAQEMITRRYVFPWWRMQRFLDMGSEKVLRQEITRFNTFLAGVIKYRRSLLRSDDAAGHGCGSRSVAHGAAGATPASCNVNQEDKRTPAIALDSVADQDLLSRFILHQEAECTAAGRTTTAVECKELEEEDPDHEANLVKEVREAMMSFVMAGRDTTASTLSWFLYCMCTNPDKQEEVFLELQKLEQLMNISPSASTGDDDEGRGAGGNSKRMSRRPTEITYTSSQTLMRGFAEKVLSYEALQSSSTPYLHGALAETLRLYPAVPRDGKVALRDDVLPDGTHLKAGDQVAYIPYAMGRMPFLWGSDALLFKPERWLDSSGAFHPQSPFKFTAFQAGPRMCLGKDAAYLQMKVTAAMLLRFFHFELVPDHPVQYRMMMVMTMKHGLRVNVTPRFK